MTRLTVVAALAVASLAAGLAASGSQSQTQRFRAGVDVVPVYVTVRDRERGFVLDLAKDDFELRDDGRLQAIEQFTTTVTPLSTVVLIDGSGSMLGEFKRVLDGANNFVLRMLPEDRTLIGSFADRAVFSRRFSSDRDELLGYLEDQFNLRIGGETHLWEALRDAAAELTAERGKRVVLAMSDGYNFALPPDYYRPQTSSAPPIVGPPGRKPIGIGGRNPGVSSLPGQPAPTPRTGVGNPNIGDPSRNGVPPEQARAAAVATDVIVYAVSMWVRDGVKTQKPSHVLEELAVETGGAFFRVDENDDMNTTFTEIVQQLRQQYVLGFTPRAFDGRQHKLSVRVKRPGLDVQARKSYIATRDRSPGLH